MAAFASSDNSLRERVREVVQNDVLRACAASCPGWMVLVLDAEASRVLTPVLGMYDLMEERVTLVESLELNRQPFKEMAVIYVAAATDESCRRIAADWEERREAPYVEAHCFFLSKLSERQLNTIGGSPALAARLRTLNELNLDFLALEAQAYTLSGIEPEAFSVAAALEGRSHMAEREVGRKLATLCATLGEAKPLVRYRAANGRAERVAGYLSSELSDCGIKTLPGHRGDATVLIVDRADDVLTPIMHEYTYQALVHDVLFVEGGDARDRVEFGGANNKKKEVAMLTEKDLLWVEMRHEHVAKVIDALRRRVSDFVANNKGAARLQQGSGSGLALTDIAAALKKMPEFQAATALLNKHMSLAHECLTKFHGAGLLEISQLEQALATGVDDEGDRCKASSLLGEVLRSLKLRTTPSDAKLRLACAYVVACKGRLATSDRESLIEALGVSSTGLGSFKEALVVIAKTVAEAGGVTSQLDGERYKNNTKVKKSSSLSSGDRRGSATLNFAAFRSAMKAGLFSTMSASSKKEEEEETVASSRYDVPVKALIELVAEDKLPLEAYPTANRQQQKSSSSSSASKATSVRKQANKFTAASKRKFVGPRIVVCVLGGCTYSEMRAAYEVGLATNREIVMGGTSLLTPKLFLNGIIGGQYSTD